MKKSAAQLEREIQDVLRQGAGRVRGGRAPQQQHATRKQSGVPSEAVLLLAIQKAGPQLRLKPPNDNVVLLGPLWRAFQRETGKPMSWDAFRTWILGLRDAGTIALMGPSVGVTLAQFAREQGIAPSLILGSKVSNDYGTWAIGVLDET